MSDPGRGDGWTELEGLLKETAARPDASSTFAAEQVETQQLRHDEASGESSLPFEDLLSELLGSWSEESETSLEPAEESGEAVEVPLSSLMARLLEDPPPPEPDAADGSVPRAEAESSLPSLGALGERLSSPDYETAESHPPESQAIAPAVDTSPTVAGEPQTEEVELPPAESVEEEAEWIEEPSNASAEDLADALVILPATLFEESAEPAAPWSDELFCALVQAAPPEDMPAAAGDQNAPAEEQSESELPPEFEVEARMDAVAGEVTSPLERAQEPSPGETEGTEGPAAPWTDELFKVLLQAAEPAETPPAASSVWEPDHLQAGEEQAESPPEAMAPAVEHEETPAGIGEESSAGWEVLASLPAPSPPSFSETMLFEPALPPASLFQWPAADRAPTTDGLGYEAVAFEEPDNSPETEFDDSLRRLVGQMLAELAVSAAPPQRTPSADAAVERATERFLSFSLAGEVYAVALAGILETDRLPRITRVPGLPAWAIGVTNLRGAILPVVDLRRLLNLEEAENPQDGRILVVRPSLLEPPAVVVVDRLEGVALLAPSELHPAPVWLDSKVLPYLEGIGSFKGRLVNVLDLGRLFKATGVTGEDAPRAGEAV